MEKENQVTVVTNNNQLVSNDITNLDGASLSKQYVFTTLTDAKTIFNLNNECDYKINDYKGKEITITDVFVKVFERPTQEVDEETGELTDRLEFKKVCILIDEDGKSYVTGSKIFTNQMIEFIRTFGADYIKSGVTIKIIEKSIKNSGNKALGFTLV